MWQCELYDCRNLLLLTAYIPTPRTRGRKLKALYPSFQLSSVNQSQLDVLYIMHTKNLKNKICFIPHLALWPKLSTITWLTVLWLLECFSKPAVHITSITIMSIFYLNFVLWIHLPKYKNSVFEVNSSSFIYPAKQVQIMYFQVTYCYNVSRILFHLNSQKFVW